jgi:hypothetical protein
MPCKTLHLLLIIQLAFLSNLFSQTNEQARANLYEYYNGVAYLDDGNLTMYNVNNSNLIDGMDAVKMTNFGENFGLERGAKTLVIERRKSISLSDTIFFKMWNMKLKTYKIDMVLSGLNAPGMTGILEDAFLNTQTVVNLNGTTSYTFDVNSTAGSYASNRFRIIFSSSQLLFAPLPVTFTGLKAFSKNNEANIKWTVENEKGISKYEVLKSINGRDFSSLGIVQSKNSSGTSEYQWIDPSIETGANFYRIKSIDINGQLQYSNIIKVNSDFNLQSVSVYPNPVTNGTINLQFTNQAKGFYSIRLINNFGQILHVSQLKHDGGNSIQTIQLNKNIIPGNYQLQVINPDNSKTNIKILMR